MSCHAIGHGINTIMEVVVGLLDEGKISVEAVRHIGAQAMMAVNYCDGNSYEAVAVLKGFRCGRCLKKVANKDELYSLYDIDYHLWSDEYDPLGLEDEPLATYELCGDCFDAVMNRCYHDPEITKRERQDIDERRQRSKNNG